MAEHRRVIGQKTFQVRHLRESEYVPGEFACTVGVDLLRDEDEGRQRPEVEQQVLLSPSLEGNAFRVRRLRPQPQGAGHLLGVKVVLPQGLLHLEQSLPGVGPLFAGLPPRAALEGDARLRDAARDRPKHVPPQFEPVAALIHRGQVLAEEMPAGLDHVIDVAFGFLCRAVVAGLLHLLLALEFGSLPLGFHRYLDDAGVIKVVEEPLKRIRGEANGRPAGRHFLDHRDRLWGAMPVTHRLDLQEQAGQARLVLGSRQVKEVITDRHIRRGSRCLLRFGHQRVSPASRG